MPPTMSAHSCTVSRMHVLSRGLRRDRTILAGLLIFLCSMGFGSVANSLPVVKGPRVAYNLCCLESGSVLPPSSLVPQIVPCLVQLVLVRSSLFFLTRIEIVGFLKASCRVSQTLCPVSQEDCPVSCLLVVRFLAARCQVLT